MNLGKNKLINVLNIKHAQQEFKQKQNEEKKKLDRIIEVSGITLIYHVSFLRLFDHVLIVTVYL